MRSGVRIRVAVVVSVLASAAGAANAQDAVSVAAGQPERGWVTLTVRGDDGTKADLYEQIGSQSRLLGSVTIRDGRAVMRHAAPWRCDRYVRHFFARTVSAPDLILNSEADPIRTPSCKHRLALRVGKTKHGRARRVVIRLSDRWKVGDVPARICVLAPGKRERCHSVRIARGRKEAILSYRARGPGVWSVALQTAWKEGATVRTYVRPAGKLHLLATGDSMIQIVDSDLAQRLSKRGVTVRSDARISTGISKPFLLNWPRLAKRQARSVRPDVTVVFLGANDGFPFGNTECCGDAWVDAYATRVQEMMTAWSRAGRGLVYWLTLPAARPAQWHSVYPAVNRALERAAAGFAGQVRIVDTARLFTPSGHFQQTIRWRGRTESVRQGDGVHLSTAGAAIAAQVIEAALRRDGVL